MEHVIGTFGRWDIVDANRARSNRWRARKTLGVVLACRRRCVTTKVCMGEDGFILVALFLTARVVGGLFSGGVQGAAKTWFIVGGIVINIQRFVGSSINMSRFNLSGFLLRLFERVFAGGFFLSGFNFFNHLFFGFFVTKDTAIKFGEFITNADNQNAFGKAANVFPSTLASAKDPYYSTDDGTVSGKARVIGNTELKDAKVLQPYVVNSAMSDYFNQQLALAIKGQISSHDALSKAQDKMNQLLEQAQ